MKLRALWIWDAAVTLVFVVFFLIGLGDGSISSFNIELWFLLLAFLAAVLLGGFALQSSGYRRPAAIVLLIPGVPGLIYALFLVAVLVFNPRWN
jgi:hypothetical protein